MTVSFSDLGSIPWKKLHHAYGPATDVPALLQALMTPEQADPELIAAAAKNNRTLFDHVTWTLWGNVFHQGTVWQATAHVVPFLADILRKGPDNPDLQTFLITYLHHLALGYPEDVFPNPPDPDEDFAEVAGQEDPGTEPEFPVDDQRPLIWMRDSYEAVEREVGTITRFLDARNDDVALAAIAFVAGFPRQAELTTGLLCRIAAKANAKGASAAISLALLDPTSAVPLARQILTCDDPETRLLAACAVMIATADDATPQEIGILTQRLGDLAKRPSAHAGDLGTLVGRCLEILPLAYLDKAIDALCAQLPHANPMQSLALTQNLLSLSFRNIAPPQKSEELSRNQRKALETIRDHGAFRVGDGLFANYGNLLHDWGLPSTEDSLRKWLRKPWRLRLFR